MERKDEIVIVKTYDHDWEAYMAKDVLENAGIPAIIGNEIFGSLYPVGFNSIGGITVSVRRGDLERARGVLTKEDLSGDKM